MCLLRWHLCIANSLNLFTPPPGSAAEPAREGLVLRARGGHLQGGVPLVRRQPAVGQVGGGAGAGGMYWTTT